MPTLSPKLWKQGATQHPRVLAVALMGTSTRQACCDAQPHIRPGHLLLMESFIPTSACRRGWHTVHGSLGMPIKTSALQWTLQAVVSHSVPWCKHRDGNNPDTAPHAWWVHPGGATPSPCTHTPWERSHGAGDPFFTLPWSPVEKFTFRSKSKILIKINLPQF